MANFIGTTASSGAKIKKGKEIELRKFLERYSTSGEDGEMVHIEEGYIQIYGYDWLNIGKVPTKEDLAEYIIKTEANPETPDEEVRAMSMEQLEEKYPTERDELEIEMRNDDDYTDEFFKGLAQFLDEPLVVQSIGNEKCRYPLSAWEIKVFPDGRIKKGGFKFPYSPDKE